MYVKRRECNDRRYVMRVLLSNAPSLWRGIQRFCTLAVSLSTREKSNHLAPREMIRRSDVSGTEITESLVRQVAIGPISFQFFCHSIISCDLTTLSLPKRYPDMTTLDVGLSLASAPWQARPGCPTHLRAVIERFVNNRDPSWHRLHPGGGGERGGRGGPFCVARFNSACPVTDVCTA